MEWLVPSIVSLTGVVSALVGALYVLGSKYLKLKQANSELKTAEANRQIESEQKRSEAEAQAQQRRIELNVVEDTHEENFYVRQLERAEREITRLNERLTAYEIHADAMQRRMDELHSMNMRCLANEELAKARLQVMADQIAQLQKIATAASIQISTTIVGDVLTGKIMEADANVRDVLGWDPNDLVGKDIDVLIPRDIQFRHHRGLERSRLSGHVRPAEIAIQSFAQRKNGERIPVIVSLNNCEGPDGQMYVAAQIMHRKMFSIVDIVTGSHEHLPLPPGRDRREKSEPVNPGRREEDRGAGNKGDGNEQVVE